MTKLQAQQHRLYIGRTADDAPHSASGWVRAMVLQISQPDSWVETSKVWQGVQADLNLPAPAIAVSGGQAYQLWFSLSEAVPAEQAISWLAALCQRYVPTLASDQIQLIPVQSDTTLPPFETQADQWSAFVAPDLAPVFAETPWLDIPPNEDGQAELLSRLDCIQPNELQKAWNRMHPPVSNKAALPMLMPARGDGIAPKQFLFDVMNDESVALALRIEAAKALLPYC